MKLKYYGFSPEAAERFNPTAYTKRVDRYYGPEYIGKFDLGAEVYVWLAQSMMAYQGKYGECSLRISSSRVQLFQSQNFRSNVS
jgi:hypothetical protein